MATASWLATVQSKKQQWESQLYLETLISVLLQNTLKKLRCINNSSGFWTVSSPRGKHISAGQQLSPQQWCSPLCERSSANSCFTCFYRSPSLPSLSAAFCFFCSVEFPQLFQLFHHYRMTETTENNASSCFGCIIVHMPPLCCNAAFSFAGTIRPSGRAE